MSDQASKLAQAQEIVDSTAGTGSNTKITSSTNSTSSTSSTNKRGRCASTELEGQETRKGRVQDSTDAKRNENSGAS